MSNPQTFYTVGGVDLSNIFQPYTSGTQASATGYKISGGADFNTIFAPYTSGTPASATGYKVGMLKILELREKSKKALGSKFDIRKFHDVILMNGAVPLSVLEELVDKWIAATKKAN